MSTTDKPPAVTQKSAPGALTGSKAPLAAIQSGIFDEVEVILTVHLGQAVMTVAEICALKVDSIVSLDLRLNEPATIHLNGKPIARGEIVAVDENFGLRINEIVPVEQP